MVAATNANKVKGLYRAAPGHRPLDRSGIGDDSEFKELRQRAKRLGLMIRTNRVSGRGRKDDSMHVQFRMGGFIIADYWGTTGRLSIGGSDIREVETAMDALDRVALIMGNADSVKRQSKVNED